MGSGRQSTGPADALCEPLSPDDYDPDPLDKFIECKPQNFSLTLPHAGCWLPVQQVEVQIASSKGPRPLGAFGQRVAWASGFGLSNLTALALEERWRTALCGMSRV